MTCKYHSRKKIHIVIYLIETHHIIKAPIPGSVATTHPQFKRMQKTFQKILENKNPRK